MHVIVPAEDSESELCSEFRLSYPEAPPALKNPAGLVEVNFPLAAGEPVPRLVFARQFLPNANRIWAESIRNWAQTVFANIAETLPETQPWSLHIDSHYGKTAPPRIGARAFHTLRRLRRAEVQSPKSKVQSLGGGEQKSDGAKTGESFVDQEAGRRRSGLIREALLELLQKKRRHLLRNLRSEPVPFTGSDSLVQVVLTSPASGFLSMAVAPLPCEHRHLISFFPGGEVQVATDKAAPSRAFAKLVEAEQRLGQKITAGQSCVDLGASPGSWSFVAVKRSARVIAVDRSPLRPDLMQDPLLRFSAGDAFCFRPSVSVDWLLCDLIAPPEQTAELLLNWLRRGWCRRFVVTIKLKDTSGLGTVDLLKRQVPPLASEFFLLRLCSNKKEICAFGLARNK